MARNRGKLLTKDELNCPACNYDYSKTNIVERFYKIGNKISICLNCDCGQVLSLRSLSNFMKIYDVTEMRKRQNLKAKMERAKIRENGRI
jgi:transcription elongation factor Elf1